MIVSLPVSQALPPHYPGWLPTSRYASCGQAWVPDQALIEDVERAIGPEALGARLEALWQRSKDPTRRLSPDSLAATLNAPASDDAPRVIAAARRAAQSLLEDA